MRKRVFVIVLDSAGIGNAPDAEAYGDKGADTFGTCIRSGYFNAPNMTKTGLFNIKGTSFEHPVDVIGCYGSMIEKSGAKDTTAGHWEIAGTILKAPFPTYPHGFPHEVLDAFSKATGRGVLCNKPYSGTEVIKDYGQLHEKTGSFIVYTSADSVFQIAAHKDVIPLEELYEACRKARAILQGEHGVGRVIARPFTGKYPDYIRTTERHDFSLQPPRETVLDAMMAAGLDTIGVGKTYDIFAGKGISETYGNEGNYKNMEKVLELANKDFKGICFVNLVDGDMIYGHRRDVKGYAQALNVFDEQLGQLMDKMRDDDIIIITADHGCDPGFRGTDHTREQVPCLVYGKSLKAGVDLGTRKTMADIGASVGEYFGLSYIGDGESFCKEILLH